MQRPLLVLGAVPLPRAFPVPLSDTALGVTRDCGRCCPVVSGTIRDSPIAAVSSGGFSESGAVLAPT